MAYQSGAACDNSHCSWDQQEVSAWDFLQQIVHLWRAKRGVCSFVCNSVDYNIVSLDEVITTSCYVSEIYVSHFSEKEKMLSFLVAFSLKFRCKYTSLNVHL